ncbi:MAG: B12-binding domain-containing radical SAM protein [Suilimivivens sp.]
MQFLLTAINAKYIHSNPAIYSLRAYAGEKLQPFISLAEYTINNRMEEILGDIYKKHPDAIGFSCYIWNFRLIQELIPEIAKVLPGIDIWLGGPEVSFEAEKVLARFPMIKGIMVGEGEEIFKDVISYYVGNGREEIGSKYHRLKDIPGLVLRDGATKVRTPMNMDEIPFPYEDLQEFENRIIYYETGRGCPFRCSYCLSSIDKSVRLRNLDTVKRELQYFLDKKVPQVKLIDRTFNCNHNHAMEIWRYIKENDNGITNFHFEVAADIMREEELMLLGEMRPGLVQLEIGVQSTNWNTLKEINRSANITQIARVVEEIRSKRNIHVHLDLIAGLPYEGFESFQKSFNDVYAMKPEQLQLGFLKVLKGTEIWEKVGQYGIVYQENPPYEVLFTKWISYEEIRKLKQIEEMVELYYNSNQFTHILPVLEKEFKAPFELFEKLAVYYEEKGYFVNAPARSNRYQVLLEFALEIAPEKEALYQELLTFDYYLRENAKSRPAFGADLSPYRDQIWEFYQREEENPQILKGYRYYHARQTMKMTHMEVLYYPVWEICENQELQRKEKPEFVLFDYEKRDALTKEAQIYVVPFSE